MSNNKQRKSRSMMYTQQLDYLPTQSVDQFIDCLENNIQPQKYAVIKHDKDIDDTGKLVAEHIHCMMTFENPRSVNHVSTLLGDKPQYVEAWKGNQNNGYAYLVHATKESASKYQYDPIEVKANFHYPLELQKITEKVDKARHSLNIKYLLDALYSGAISKEDLENQLTGSEYARAKRQIEDVYAKYLQKRANTLREQMVAEGRQLEVVWIYGSAGVGKTRFACETAKKKDEDFFISGSSRDAFQNYRGQQTIILDELRPRTLPYQDLLRILDPFGMQVNAPSRYYDKPLCCDTIIITSPFDPLAYYREEFGIDLHTQAYKRYRNLTDSFEQLLRRITLTVEINEYWIDPMEFDLSSYNFVQIPNAGRKNHYIPLSQSTQQPTGNKVDLFNSMFD